MVTWQRGVLQLYQSSCDMPSVLDFALSYVSFTDIEVVLKITGEVTQCWVTLQFAGTKPSNVGVEMLTEVAFDSYNFAKNEELHASELDNRRICIAIITVQ